MDSNVIYTPYTYLIGWSNHNKWYYGVRFAKNCNPCDLWSLYFTSSKYVKKFRKKFGEPDVIEIRKTFDCPEKARLWEEKVLKRINVIGNEKWLNRAIGKAVDPDTFRESARKNMIENNPMFDKSVSKRVGSKLSIIQREKMSKMTTEEKSNKFGNFGSSNPFYGKKHSKELKEQISNKLSKKYLIIEPNGNEKEIINLHRYCKDNNLNRDALMESMRNGWYVTPPKSRRQPTKSRFNTIGYRLIKLNN